MVLYKTMHSTSSCKQWCYTILCTPPAAASNCAVQYYAIHQQLQAMVLYNTMHSTSSCKQYCCTILCTPPAAASNGAVQHYHSTSSCKQWCSIILCPPPAAASNGAVPYSALHQQLQAMVLYKTMDSTSSGKQW